MRQCIYGGHCDDKWTKKQIRYQVIRISIMQTESKLSYLIQFIQQLKKGSRYAWMFTCFSIIYMSVAIAINYLTLICIVIIY